MVDEKTRFHCDGLSWAERASLGGLEAVLSPTGSPRRNAWYHGINWYGAAQGLKYLPNDRYIIDFGCGNGRFMRYYASKGRHIVGTEITWEMVADAKTKCPDQSCQFVITDGISIPVRDNSIGGIWCCAVLRMSLLVSNPCYAEIAKEMFRVLRPGGYVVNSEMYVDVPAERFLDGFEQAGFRTRRVNVMHRDRRFLERCLSNRRIPERWLRYSAGLCAGFRSMFDHPNRAIEGLRDYYFVWQKPDGSNKREGRKYA
jgi:SAM-dependent methyltransferase